MSIRDKTWYPIAYMFVVTAFFTTILIFFGNFTQERVDDNARIAFERAVLEALPAGLSESASPLEIHKTYLETVKQASDSTPGVLQYMKGDSLIAYALPIQGPGFWAMIRGVVGVAADRKTITGISFYEQNETPGLGGEIVKPGFRNQFKSKKMVDQGTPIEMRMASAKIDEHSVHAVTGATQTSMRLAKFMNEKLIVWRDSMKGKE